MPRRRVGGSAARHLAPQGVRAGAADCRRLSGAANVWSALALASISTSTYAWYIRVTRAALRPLHINQ
jgi:hypothetical protein